MLKGLEMRYRPRIINLALVAVGFALLTACSGIMEARPVCTQSHGGGGKQLAPMYVCEQKLGGKMENK
jgi:hypothetical protein